jgi:chromosomal replication initiator protein
MRDILANLARTGDVEAMAAILQETAHEVNVALPRDVAFYLAQNVCSSERELRGALARLAAHFSMTGTEITLASTQRVLKKFIDAKACKSTFDPIQSVYQQYLAKQTKAKAEDRVAEGRDFFLCLKTRDGKKACGVRLELEVNMRESERKQLARRDAYERDLERRARKRSRS